MPNLKVIIAMIRVMVRLKATTHWIWYWCRYHLGVDVVDEASFGSSSFFLSRCMHI